MRLGNVVDQLHDDDGFADAGPAKQADLAALHVGLNEIDHLDAGFEHLRFRRLLRERGRGAVNRERLGRLDGATLVDRLAEDVQHAAQHFVADGYHDGRAERFRTHAAHQAFGGLQGDHAHAAFADVLRDFADDVDRRWHGEAFAGDADGRINYGQLPIGELHVHRGSGDLNYFSNHGSRHKYFLFQSSSTADDFDNFLSNTGLPDAVHVERQLLNDVGGIRTGRIHGRHPGGLFGGD